MFAITKPGVEQIARFIAEQEKFDFSYPDVGATAGAVPEGYDNDSVVVWLGNGAAAFERAQEAFRNWQQFAVGWAAAVPDDRPIEEGTTVAIRARACGLWSLAACRIIRVVDEDSPTRRFGFSYGTLPDHPEQGEEQFLIEQGLDDSVRYEVTAFFRPNHVLIQLGWPYFRRLFNQFRRDSARNMFRAVHG